MGPMAALRLQTPTVLDAVHGKNASALKHLALSVRS
jgi:hypothetical protein